MICPRCGREIPDGTVCPCNYETPVLSSNPAVNAIKTIGSSPLFLAAVILYTVSLVLSAVFIASGASNAVATVLTYMVNSGVIDPYTAYDIMEYASGYNYGASLWALILPVLTCIGMWMFYATCRNRRNGNISTAGLTICKVIMIIGLVCLIIGAACMLVLFVIFLVSGGVRYMDDWGTVVAGMSALLAILLFICLAVLVLMICFYGGIVKIINRIKGCAATGLPNNRISRYVTVLLYISGIFSCISGLIELFSSPLSGIATLAGAVCSILVAVALGRLRQQMEALLYPSVQPVYASQPVQQAYVPVQPAAPAPVEAPAPAETPASEEKTEK